MFFSSPRASVYHTVSRLDGAFKQWRAEAARRAHLRSTLVSALLHWSNLSAAKAFSWWKEWALSRAALHRCVDESIQTQPHPARCQLLMPGGCWPHDSH